MAHRVPATAWNLRPSPALERTLVAAGTAVCLLVGWGLLVETEQVWWMLLFILASIWVALRGMPRLVRGLESTGVFGRVRHSEDALRARGRDVDLDAGFEAETRLEQEILSHEFQLRDVSSPFGFGTMNRTRRTERRAVSVLGTRLTQAGRPLNLVADEVGPPPLPSYDLRGLSWHRAPIRHASGPVLRMGPTDLIALLHVLQEADGFSVAALPEGEARPPDPRRRVWPRWPSGLGVAWVVLLAVGVAWWSFDGAQTRRVEEAQAARLAARAEGEEQAQAARLLMGRQVRVPARRGISLRGAVLEVGLEEHTVWDPEQRTVWRPVLTVAVDALLDEQGEVMPPDATVPFRHADDIVGPGQQVEVTLDEIEETTAGRP